MVVAKHEHIQRPVLRYHGGKWMLAPWILSFFSEHRCYVEPYGGAGSVLFRKPRSHSEIWNDLDDEVVNFFEVLREPKQTEVLQQKLRLTPWSRTEFFKAYEATEESIERARRLVVRSFMAFGTTGRRKNRSGFRGKSERHNKTGVHDWLNYPACLTAVTERLRGVVIECRPAIEILKQQNDREALAYCDPPYLPETRTSVRWNSENDRCYAHEMDESQHREMAEALHAFKGKVVLSGYASPLYDEELFKDWYRFQRHGFANNGAKRVEVVWLNGAAFSGMQKRPGPLFWEEEQC